MKKIALIGISMAAAVGAACAAERLDYAAPQGWGAFLSDLSRSLDATGFLLLTVLVVAVGMAVDAFCGIRLSKMIPESFLAAVQEEMSAGEYEKALEVCRESNCLAGQIFTAALAKADHSFDRMQNSMRSEAAVLGLVWRQLVGQLKLTALAGTVLGILGALVNLLRFVSHLQGRPNVGMALASSFEMRSLLYGTLSSLFLGALVTGASLFAFYVARAKLERILLECDRLGEEILDPFRPLPTLEG